MYSLSIYMYMYMCVYIYICMCIYIHICVCVEHQNIVELTSVDT